MSTGSLSTAAAEEGKFRRSAAPVPGSYFVILNEPQADLPDFRERELDKVEPLLKDHGGKKIRRIRAVAHGFTVQLPEPAAIELSQHPGIKYVEEDGIAIGATDQAQPPSWGLDRVDQAALPANNNYSYFLTGLGVHAYVIDSGIRATHQDFAGRIGSGHTEITNDTYGTDDCYGHGTGVAGIIGGTEYGVAKQVTLHPVRVLDCANSGTTTGVVNGLDWVRLNAIHPAIANASLVGPASSTLDTAATNLINSGIMLIAAAGNNRDDACNFSPQRVARVTVVAASDASDGYYDYSNYGNCVDLFAPGVSITMPYKTNDSSTVTRSGTSFAAPHVTGAAALAMEASAGHGSADSLSGFILSNAAAGTIADPYTNAHGLVQTRWTDRLIYSSPEDCYDLIGASCYSQLWTPACPARPVDFKPCGAQDSCWSVVTSRILEEFICVSH